MTYPSQPGHEPSSEDTRSLEQLALVYAMVDHLQRARRVEHVYQEAADGLRTALSADRSALLTEEAGGEMRVRAWSGLSAVGRAALNGHSPWHRNGPTPEPVTIEEVAARTEEPVYEALWREGVETVVWIPLLHRGRILGALMLGRTTSRPFEEREVRLAEVIAGHVAFSIWRTQSDEDQAELLRRFEAERSVLESVVQHMPAGVLLADVPSGRIITSNPQITAIWRKKLRHAERISDYGMWGGLDADGRAMDPAQWPLARSVEHGETVQGEEIRIERGDGTRGIIRMSSAPVVDGRGQQLAAVATVFDVTREREQELRNAFLEDATQVLNESLELDATLRSVATVAVGRYADWCVLYRGSGDLLEPVAAEHRGTGECDVLHRFLDHPSPEGGGCAANDVVRRREPLMVSDPDAALDAMAGSEEALRAAARTLGCGSVLVLPLVSRDRELGALCLVRTDAAFTDGDLQLMTELARRASMAADNALLYERALAADRAKSSFLAVMSHEFRTPLSAILGYADILTTQVHGELNPKQTGHLERVKASVRHMSHLVDEILSFASMEAERERVVRERTELRALVADAMGIMEPIAEATGLALEVDLPEEEIVLWTDPSKVRQIVINLVSNALKYTPQGTVEIQLLEAEEAILLHVVDTGPGIAAEYADLVFEPFWQVDQSAGRRITGTGLGLAVARRLARLLGGDVTLESDVGVGSRFTLMLPGEASGVADSRVP